MSDLTIDVQKRHVAVHARTTDSPIMRRALFQVHLWTGLAGGLYILAICLSGSAIVFRLEMNRAFCRRDVSRRSSPDWRSFTITCLAGVPASW